MNRQHRSNFGGWNYRSFLFSNSLIWRFICFSKQKTKDKLFLKVDQCPFGIPFILHWWKLSSYFLPLSAQRRNSYVGCKHPQQPYKGSHASYESESCRERNTPLLPWCIPDLATGSLDTRKKQRLQTGLVTMKWSARILDPNRGQQ